MESKIAQAINGINEVADVNWRTVGHAQLGPAHKQLGDHVTTLAKETNRRIAWVMASAYLGVVIAGVIRVLSARGDDATTMALHWATIHILTMTVGVFVIAGIQLGILWWHVRKAKKARTRIQAILVEHAERDVVHP